YFVRTSPAAEVLGLLRHAVSFLLVRRLGFMYLQGLSFGDKEYQIAQQTMSKMGEEFSGVFTLNGSYTGSADDAVFNAEWEKFAATRPQAVIVFGARVNDTVKFIKRMITNTSTADAYLLGPFALQDILLSTWREAVAGGAKFVNGRLITTGTNPLAKDTRYNAIKRFKNEMKKYLSTHPGDYPSTDYFLKNETVGELMVTGWIAGEVLNQAVSVPEVLKNNTKFKESLFDQRRYKIDDLVIGDFGGDCSDIADLHGAICRCNQGGRTVFVKHFVENFVVWRIVEATLLLDKTRCYADNFVLLSPFGMLTMVMTDRQDAVTAMEDIKLGTTAAVGRQQAAEGVRFFAMRTINTTVVNASDALTKESEMRFIDCVVGALPEYLLNTEGATFIDPVPLQSHVSEFRRHVIYLSPTLEQEFFVVAQYLGSTTGANAHAVIRSDGAAAVVDVWNMSLVTFGGSLLSSALLGGGDALESHLPRKGVVFVVGLAAADVAVVAGHLAKHSGVRVFVLFTEFSLLYGEFVAAFNGSAAAERLVFATSLPHWAKEYTRSPSVQKFHAAVEDKTKWTPLALRSFANTLLLKTILSRMDQISAELLADFIYTNVAIRVDDMLYGTFDDTTDCALQGVEGEGGCAMNYGATRISVWSMARVFDPAVPELFPPVTPSMVYTKPDTDSVVTAFHHYAIIFGSILGGLVMLAVALSLLFCCGRKSRDNNNAPKEPTDPVTLVFTDIESSTALWAACPEIMPD
ncbi:receptor-type adenylate cyclase, partial [Trypanosoma grayi]|uniref:receptor-type adenylate cyclase n=1 Tax=Trypanosoma grayi TaxID=71804 RepID=UPI0004F40BA2